MLSLHVLLLAGGAILVGATVQGTVGFGLGLLAAPVLTMTDASLVPGTLLLVTVPLPLLTLLRERAHVDWRGVGWAMLGRLPATLIGVLLVSALPATGIAVVVAVVVLGAVGLSLSTWHPRPVPGALAAASAVSGVTGTVTAVGGPPMAIVYQHHEGRQIRATLGAFFMLGTVISAVALRLAGHLDGGDVRHALVLVPFMVAGFLASGPLRRPLDRGWTRPAVLTLAALSASVLLVRSLL